MKDFFDRNICSIYFQTMKLSREIHTGRHCVFELYVHLVFTKIQISVLTKVTLYGNAERFAAISNRLIEFGEEDLVHCASSIL